MWKEETVSVELAGETVTESLALIDNVENTMKKERRNFIFLVIKINLQNYDFQNVYATYGYTILLIR